MTRKKLDEEAREKETRRKVDKRADGQVRGAKTSGSESPRGVCMCACKRDGEIYNSKKRKRGTES